MFLHISAKLLLPLREMSTSPHRPPLEGEAEVFCFDEGGMGVPSSKRSQPVPSLDMGGQTIVQTCDIHSMFLSDWGGVREVREGGGGVKLQTGAGRELRFLHPFSRTVGSSFSSADTALVPPSCLRHRSRRGRRHAGP